MTDYHPEISRQSISANTDMVLLKKPGGARIATARRKKKKTGDRDKEEVVEAQLETLPKKLRVKARKITQLLKKHNLLSLDEDGHFQFPASSVNAPEDFETSYYHSLLRWFLTKRDRNEKETAVQPLDADQFERYIIRKVPGVSKFIAPTKLHNGRRRISSNTATKNDKKHLKSKKTDAAQANNWIKLSK